MRAELQHLLVATDLSPRADRAVARAVALARRLPARLTVLHVVGDVYGVAAVARKIEKAREEIAEFLAGLPEAAELAVDVEIAGGAPADAICEVAAQRGAGLIVLGTHREDMLKDLFAGATMGRVLRHAAASVLLVKWRPRRDYRRVVVAVDLSEPSRRALDVALAFAPEAEFHVVHAFEPPFPGFITGADAERQVGEDHRHRLAEMIRSAPAGDPRPGIEPVLRRGPARQVVPAEVEHLEADLLVVGTHGRTGIAHAMLGSVAEDLLRFPPCDTLVVRAAPPTLAGSEEGG